MQPANEERHGEQDSTCPAGWPRAEGRRAVPWTDRTAAWYRHAAERGDYAARVLGAVGPRLDTCRTALANEDPLFGARPREEFRRRFGLILNRAPAPIGLGAARQST